jgi:hypothetical protein
MLLRSQGMSAGYRIAGIDVHKSMLAVVVTELEEQGELRFQRRKFGTVDSQLAKGFALDIPAVWGRKFRVASTGYAPGIRQHWRFP